MRDFNRFSQGGSADTAKPSAKLAGILEHAAGLDRRYSRLDDDELTGALGRWAATEAYACSQKLRAVVELVRRRGIDGLGMAAGPGAAGEEVPRGWDASLAEEVAMALAMSKPAADKLVTLAVTLATRLDATAAALEAGEVDYVKAAIMAEVTSVLSDEAAWNAEKLTLMQAGGSFKDKTPGELRKLIERASIAADPRAAEHRREEAEKAARVQTWRESTGTMALAATGLNPQDAMDAEAAITDRAQQYKKAGLPGGMDKLRAQAMTDKLTGRNPLGSGQAPVSAVPRRVHLTVPEPILPLLTVLGIASNPGEVPGLGAIDPGMVQKLAAAAAEAGDQTEWHLTLTDENGWMTCHGCPPANPRTKQGKKDAWGAEGTWSIDLPGGQRKTFSLHPFPVDQCDHRYRTEGHDPSPLLRHLTEVRDGTCTRPGCARPAATCDYEHAIPFEQGGITCACNGSAKCRHDHVIKQDRNWQVTQIAPGFRRWRAPSGRTYTSQPRQYPV